MALVCDIESTPAPEETAAPDNPDLEDGEIEDDGDDDVPAETPPPPKEVEPPANNAPVVILPKEKVDRDRPPRHERVDRRRHDEKKKHMTEAEKSILHLRKRERMQREKWEKYRKEQIAEPPDDFAINIEKAIASVLNKKDKHSDEEKDEEKRGRKRKNRDKDNRQQKKQRKIDSPKSEEFDENEFLNVRGGSPNRTGNSEQEKKDNQQRSPSHSRSDDSYDSEYSSDRSKSDDRRDGRKREYNKKNKNRNRDRNRKKSRERNNRQEQPQFKDAQGVCVFFLQGKCQKNDCPYSHEAVPPMKLELCKFYLKDCCAKGEKCSYMHSEFPCKFYHTGLVCLQAENCKFAHGKPLDEHRKQILFKHIETAPREILGGFPRMSREEALNKINQAQQNLMVLYGSEKKDEKGGLIPSLFEINIPVPSELNNEDATNKPKPEKPPRNRPSRWQDPDPVDQVSQVQVPPPAAFPINFNYVAQDQDMRVNSNGDIDMRTLPPLHAAQIAPPQQNTGIPPHSIPEEMSDATNFTQDIDIRNPNMLQFDTKDVDIRRQTIMADPRLLLATKDVDIRQIPSVFDASADVINKQPQQMAPQEDDDEEESQLHIDTGEVPEETESGGGAAPPPNLPKTQRELYMRIQSQQKTNLPEQQQQRDAFEVEDSSINWYSDDDDEDENRLTIKVDNEEEKKEKEEEIETIVGGGDIMSPPQVKPLDVVEKLGDLSKIDISAEVTKLLTSISQTASTNSPKEPPKVNRDPRQQAQPPILADPRQQRATNVAEQPKISIYEQGSIPPSQQTSDEPRSPDDLIETDFRGRPDVDLRNLHLPFKGMLNYTPAKEIDASVNSHPPMAWKIQVVDIPRPDYTGLKLNVQDAEKTGDPRLRKIFRLSTEEKDSPASPKASPKAATTTRIDPRLKKIEESKQQQQQATEGLVLTYNQQLNILQSSAFFQSLTSNQKLLLNQELASRNEQNGYHDPVLNSVLSTLNLLPNQATAPTNPNNMGAALNILANVNKLNPAAAAAVAPPAAPMVPRQNLNLMNQMAQSMVQPGLLGAAPGIPNLPADFPMNFPGAPGDPRMNPPPFGNFPPPQDNNFGNFDDYYPPVQDNGYNGRDNRNFNNRDRRRGRNNFHNRNAGNRNFRNRNNRSNRSHTPP